MSGFNKVFASNRFRLIQWIFDDGPIKWLKRNESKIDRGKSALSVGSSDKNTVDSSLIKMREEFWNQLIYLEDLRIKGFLSEDEFKEKRKSLIPLLKK